MAQIKPPTGPMFTSWERRTIGLCVFAIGILFYFAIHSCYHVLKAFGGGGGGGF